MGDAPRIPDRIGETDDTAADISETCDGIEASCLDNRAQILNVLLEGELNLVVIGETASAPVIADQRMALRQLAQPGPPDWAVPVRLDVMNPWRRPDQGWPIVAHTVGDRACRHGWCKNGSARNEAPCGLRLDSRVQS